MNEDEAIDIILDNKKEYEEIIKELEDLGDGNDKPIRTIKDCQKFVQAIETILNELEKKDKIINAMAKFIDTELSSEHLTRVLKKEVLPLKTYQEDIKQYFEKEVKDE